MCVRKTQCEREYDETRVHLFGVGGRRVWCRQRKLTLICRKRRGFKACSRSHATRDSSNFRSRKAMNKYGYIRAYNALCLTPSCVFAVWHICWRYAYNPARRYSSTYNTVLWMLNYFALCIVLVFGREERREKSTRMNYQRWELYMTFRVSRLQSRRDVI